MRPHVGRSARPPEAHLRAARQKMADNWGEILNQIQDELERWSKHLSDRADGFEE